MPLRDDQIKRYSRHLLMREFSGAAQERLLRSRVRIHGTGSSAELCVLYLAAAGVGSIRLASRTASAVDVARRARALNPDAAVTAGAARGPADFVIDFARKADSALVRRIAASLRAGVPHVLSVSGAGAAIVKRYREGDACPACLLRAAGFGPGDRVEVEDLGAAGAAGAAGPAVAAIATLEIAGIGSPPSAAVLIDPRRARFEDLDVRPSPACAACAALATRRPSP